MERRELLTSGAAFAALLGAVATTNSALAQTDDLATAKGLWGEKVSTDDYVEILQLYNRYCHALDMGTGEAFAACFTPDGEFTGGRGPGKANDDRTPRKGTAALTKMGSTSGTRHFTANLLVTKTPEGAKGSCYLLLYSARTVPDSWVEVAVYNDTLVKTKDGWKFKKRVVWRDDDDITPFKPKPLSPAAEK
ncbi:MAG TPA: nuclear transport factor 2 family protein [Rhizomicrobium sp.]